MSWLGLDVGTSGCKAAVFDDRGRQLAHAYRSYDITSPQPGWAELDAEAVLRAVAEVVAQASAGQRVAAMAIACQGEAVVPIGADGRILGPLQVSSDARALDLATSWSERDDLYRTTGHTAHPMFSLFKLVWLRRERPELWARAAGFHCVEDLVHRALGLDPAMGWPLAGRTLLFDVVRHDWDDHLLELAGLDRRRLPRTLPAGAVVGRLPTARWGLEAGTLVVAGGHDQPMAALGAGVVRPGQAAYATGTVECLCPALASPPFSDALRDANLCTYDHAAPGLSASVAFCLTGGNLLRWFRDQCGGGAGYEALLAEADLPPTSLLALPYLTPSGTPHFDAVTPGAVLGLRLSTTRGELLRAFLEGIAFEMRLNVELYAGAGVRLTELRATGGAARNRVWNQLRADVLGVPLAVAEVADAGCLGGAMLAAAATGLAPLSELAAGWVRLGDVCVPDPGRAARYRERFQDWRRVYPALRDLQTRMTPCSSSDAPGPAAT